MTISQPAPQCSKPEPFPALTRIMRAIGHWQRRRNAQVELRRLMRVGDYLLQDVGLDPKRTRMDPSAAAEQFMRRK